MAKYEQDVVQWITVRGNHIPILKGQSEEDAISEWLNKKSESNAEIKATTDEDDIDSDIELEDEDAKMPYNKKYYVDPGTWYSQPFIIDESEIDKYFGQGYAIHELYITDEMNDKMNELIKEFAPSNNILSMLNQYNDYLRFNSDLTSGERKMLSKEFRKEALKACEAEAQKYLEKLPKLSNNSVDVSYKEANTKGYEESLKAPYGSKERDWYTSNCQRCIIAYEMRRRGYDVEANKYLGRVDRIYNTRLSLSRAFLDYDSSVNTKHYETQPNGEKYSSRGALIKAMERDMLKEGEGARFELNWDWKNASYGHTVNAEVVNGEVKVYDAQIGVSYTIKDLIDNKSLRATSLAFTRLDTLKLSNRLEELIKWNH